MFATIFLFLFSFFTVFTYGFDEKIGKSRLIDMINRNKHYPWTASANSKFADLTLIDSTKKFIPMNKYYEDVKLSRQLYKTFSEFSKEKGDSDSTNTDPTLIDNVPTNFDARSKWDKCVIPVRDQQSCNGCYAFAAAEMFSWRRCISGFNPYLMSEQFILNCDKVDFGCNGGLISTVLEFLRNIGTTELSCLPFIGDENKCSKKCMKIKSINHSFDSKFKLYRLEPLTILRFESVYEIQKEISLNGPVQTGITVTSDFFLYTSGIYVRFPLSRFVGGHSILIVGYGTDKVTNLDYFICLNSWNNGWGEDGYFKIEVNQLNIQDIVMAGCPEGGSSCMR